MFQFHWRGPNTWLEHLVSALDVESFPSTCSSRAVQLSYWRFGYLSAFLLIMTCLFFSPVFPVVVRFVPVILILLIVLQLVLRREELDLLRRGSNSSFSHVTISFLRRKIYKPFTKIAKSLFFLLITCRNRRFLHFRVVCVQ